MKRAGVKSRFMLLRAPMRSEMEETISLADISLNSEISTLKSLNHIAHQYGRKHEVVLMIELGDRREGVLQENALEQVKEILELRSLKLAGIGANLTCLNGIKPTAEKMAALSALADEIEQTYNMKLEIVSGGNSANYQWLSECSDAGRINHLRIGETILFGSDPITQEGINGFEHDTFRLQAEVIESMRKPSKPNGVVSFDAFGQVPQVKDKGPMRRAILAIGSQDVDPSGCRPLDPDLRIIGTTSDHMVIDSGEKMLNVGDIVEFRLHYRALLRLMVSGYVEKNYLT